MNSMHGALNYKEKIMAEKKEEVIEKVDVQKFKARKLKAINKMQDKAKAKAAADRVLANK